MVVLVHCQPAKEISTFAVSLASFGPFLTNYIVFRLFLKSVAVKCLSLWEVETVLKNAELAVKQ